MNYIAAEKIYCTIKKTSLIELKNDLIKSAIKYAQIRAEWSQLSKKERIKKDKMRTISHNAFISTCNALSRNMGKLNEDNLWREILTNDRRIIGDFACYLHCIIGVENS